MVNKSVPHDDFLIQIISRKNLTTEEITDMIEESYRDLEMKEIHAARLAQDWKKYLEESQVRHIDYSEDRGVF